MTSNSRPTANSTSLRVKGSRWPAERLTVRRTPLATARTLPTSRVYSVTMRSASPRSIRFRMTAGVRYRRLRATGLGLPVREHAGKRLDQHPAHCRVDLLHDLFNGRHEDLAALAPDDIHVVGAGLDDVCDVAQDLVTGHILDLQADDLVPVKLALREGHSILGADLNLFVPERFGRVAGGDVLQFQEDGPALDARALNDVRLAVNQDGVSAAEALLWKIGDDAALQLATDAVRREHLRDHQKLGR